MRSRPGLRVGVPWAGPSRGCGLDDDLGVVTVLWAAASPSLGGPFPGLLVGSWGAALGAALGQRQRTNWVLEGTRLGLLTADPCVSSLGS